MKEAFKKTFTKKGQSAMVATVLLIMMAIVTGVLVTTFSQKSSEKVSDKIVELGTSVECNDIRLSLSVVGEDIVILNRGTLGVDKIFLNKFFEASVETKEIDKFTGDADKLLPGKDDEGNRIDFKYAFANFENGGYDRIEAKPVFLNEEGDLIGCNTASYVKEE